MRVSRYLQSFPTRRSSDLMGGTWAQNTYPGAAVDVQSPLYSIESEPYDWSQMFAEQHELREYTEHVLARSEEHTSELQSRPHLVCRLQLEKKKLRTSIRSN